MLILGGRARQPCGSGILAWHGSGARREADPASQNWPMAGRERKTRRKEDRGTRLTLGSLPAHIVTHGQSES